jgi:hypothetical protein
VVYVCVSVCVILFVCLCFYRHYSAKGKPLVYRENPLSDDRSPWMRHPRRSIHSTSRHSMVSRVMVSGHPLAAWILAGSQVLRDSVHPLKHPFLLRSHPGELSLPGARTHTQRLGSVETDAPAGTLTRGRGGASWLAGRPCQVVVPTLFHGTR